MGCFLACFGSSKDRRRREQSIRRAQPRVQRCPSFKPVHVPSEQVSAETVVDPVPEFQCKDEPVEQLSLDIKKVTFDSNVKTYEADSLTDCALDTNNGVKEDGDSEKSSNSPSLSGDLTKLTRAQSSSSSVTSMESYPPSHRYQNCRESDDEGEEMEQLGLSDIDNDDDDDCLWDDEDDEDGLVHLRTKISADQVITEEVDCTERSKSKAKAKPIGSSNPSPRARSTYVHGVLNPVENLSQWRAVKAKGKPLAKPQKENFSSGPSVDASLSNWLVSSPEVTSGSDACTPMGRNRSPGSNSLTSYEDRPILGALTIDEIRQFSAPSSSPRKSPCRSPDDMAIIGTVGTYWTSPAPAPAKQVW